MSSSPLMSGMLMSVMTRSYGPRGRRRSASKPPPASTTSTSPRALLPDSSAVRTNERMLNESSTTRIFGTVLPLVPFLLRFIRRAQHDRSFDALRVEDAHEPRHHIVPKGIALLRHSEGAVPASVVNLHGAVLFRHLRERGDGFPRHVVVPRPRDERRQHAHVGERLINVVPLDGRSG